MGDGCGVWVGDREVMGHRRSCPRRLGPKWSPALTKGRGVLSRAVEFAQSLSRVGVDKCQAMAVEVANPLLRGPSVCMSVRRGGGEGLGPPSTTLHLSKSVHRL